MGEWSSRRIHTLVLHSLQGRVAWSSTSLSWISHHSDDQPASHTRRLSVAHMIHDAFYPLYQRNVDEVVDAMVTAASRQGRCTAFPSSLHAVVSVFCDAESGGETKVSNTERAHCDRDGGPPTRKQRHDA